MPNDLQQLLQPVVSIARSAGEAILEIYGREFAVETKEDSSPLTEADRAAHELIVRELKRLDPDIPVWSEESAAIPFAERREWKEFWLVDPLDGTKEFVKRNGEFTVNIALVRGHKPVLGVVHVPVRDEDYFAAEDCGAWRAAGGETQAIAVSGPAASPVRVVGSRSHRGASLEEFLRHLETRHGAWEMVPMGSSLKLCLVASGLADVYPRLGPTSEWDTAAAQAIVECAGGIVIDTDGKPLRCNTQESVLNPHFIVSGNPAEDWLGYLGSA